MSSGKKRQLTYTGQYKQSLRQSILTPRDRAVQRVLKTPKPASLSKKRQETLTQIGYVVCPTSDDLEYTDGNNSDSDFEDAPHGSKRRKISSEPQVAIVRQTRRSTRQANQKQLNICEDDNEGARTTDRRILVSEDEPNRDEEKTPCLRKQGMISKTHASAAKQRGSQRGAFDMTPFHEDGDLQGHTLDTDAKMELPSTISLPLPKTPQPSSRRKEIPCSQSSADTNLSTQSRRSVRELSRSPLKERSKNIGVFSTGAVLGLNGNYRMPKLEIADSMEDILNVNYPTIRPGPMSIFSQEIELTDENGWRVEADSSSRHEKSDSYQQVPGTPLVASGSGRKSIKTEVSDSDAEDEDACHGNSEFYMGTDTQVASGDFYVKSETELQHFTCLHDSGGRRQIRRNLMDSKRSGTPTQRSNHSHHSATPTQNEVLGSFPEIGKNPATRCVTPENSSRQGLGASDAQITPKQIYNDPSSSSGSTNHRLNSKLPTQSQKHHPHSHRSLVQTPPSIRSSPTFASIELFPHAHKKGVFSLPRPRLALETESQFENAWHDYTPAPTLSDEELDHESAVEFQDPFTLSTKEFESHHIPPNLSDDTVLSLPKMTSQQQQPTSVDISQSPPQSPPTPLYRKPSPSLSTSFEIHNHTSPILPSPQFRDSLSTTVRTTTTTNPLRSQASNTPADITTKSQTPPTTSPPKPASSPSPIANMRNAAVDGYAGEWNGIRLTDSQLLPESLINGSLVGPPMMMTLEGIDEEDLEYEEL